MNAANLLTMLVGGLIAGTIGFIFGVLKEHPKVSNFMYKYVRVKLHDVTYNTSGKFATAIFGEYTLTNGQPNAVHYNEVAVEFNDGSITTANAHARTLGQLLDKKKSKWIIINQEISAVTSVNGKFTLDNAKLLEDINRHPQLKIRIVVNTYRFGKIKSEWHTIEY